MRMLQYNMYNKNTDEVLFGSNARVVALFAHLAAFVGDVHEK